MSEPGDSSSEEALIEIRRSKARRVREHGQNPFANDVEPADRALVKQLRVEYASALLEPKQDLRYDPALVTSLGAGKVHHVFGRIMARRGFGKAAFLELRDATGPIQLFAKQDVMGEAFRALEEIEVADHVEARGSAMVTKTGELSLMVTELRLLTKALRPLPDKWHGLTDVDLRYRQRYVDLIASPDVAAVIRSRGHVLRGLRRYLDGRGFVEVETPSLHSLVGGAAAKPFETFHNTLELPLFLRIAPELHLKRLLVGGLERVYEIGRSYRNEGISTRHNPEFTMMELYQAYATYETLMASAEEMFREVDRALGEGLEADGFGETYARFKRERPFTLDEPFVRLPMLAGIQASLSRAELPESLVDDAEGIALSKAGASGEPDKAAREKADAVVAGYRARSERAGKIDWGNLRRALGHCDSRGERIFILYEYVAEPFLPEDYRSQDGSKSRPVFVMDYPAEVSPLARRKDADPSLVDRFELFVHGRELGNAFSELNDPDDQAERFRAQVEKKQRGAEETMDYDADYVRALEHGMPPAAGFGLGIDRLLMALVNQPSIRDVIAFPLMRPEGGD
jgi:lysyl-tRNA synthetase, class II